jgi:hypothetical protein
VRCHVGIGIQQILTVVEFKNAMEPFLADLDPEDVEDSSAYEGKP